MSQNLSLHENYRDDAPTAVGSDRAFGCTLGTVLLAIGAAKALIAAAVTLVSLLIFALGIGLVAFGFVAPARLSRLNRFWLKIGAVLALVVNPVILAILFFLVVTPMALVMRLAGKRPLRLAPDRAAASYWIGRAPSEGGISSMRRQF